MGGVPGDTNEPNTLAYVSLGFGVTSFASVACCCVPVVGGVVAPAIMFVFGLTAIITGVFGRRKATEIGRGQTEATAGIVLGSIWVFAAIVSVVLFFTGCAGCAGLSALGSILPPPH